jgi:hypothetical protein
MKRWRLTSVALVVAFGFVAMASPASASHGNDSPVDNFDNKETRVTSLGEFRHTWAVGSSTMNPCYSSVFNNSDNGLGTLKVQGNVYERNNGNALYAATGWIEVSSDELFIWPIVGGSAIAQSAEPYIKYNVQDWNAQQGWHDVGPVTIDLFVHFAGEDEIYYTLHTQPYC